MIEKAWYHQDKYKMCKSYKDVFIQHGSTHHVTFNFNPKATIHPKNAHKTLHEWHKRLDKALYKNKYYKLCREDRTSFVAVTEHQLSNFHFHAVLITNKPEQFEAIAGTIWEGLVPKGHLFISEKKTIADWAGYMTKELMHGNNLESIFYSYAKEYKEEKIKNDK